MGEVFCYFKCAFAAYADNSNRAHAVGWQRHILYHSAYDLVVIIIDNDKFKSVSCRANCYILVRVSLSF